MRSTYKRLLAVLGVVGLLALPAAPALAEDPVTLDPVTKVVDSAGVLGDRRGEVEQAIKQLGADHAMTYHVVYVKKFENPTDRYAWATEVADTASLGANAMLLTVATDTRQYLLSKPSNSKITDAQRDTIVTSAVDPNLRDGNYAQAAIDSAAAIGDAASGGKGTVPSEGGGAGSAVLVGVGVVAAGGAGAYLYLRNRRKKAAAGAQAGYGPQGADLDPLAGLTVEELRRKSGSLLIEADDAIKSSEQELGFAQAQYGDAAVGNFTKALEDAKGHMSESFKLQQQLDDHIPDTEEQQRTWLGEIIRRSEAALASLQEQKADFDSLRELEKNAPQALAAVSAGASEAEAKIASAERSLAELRAKYAESALVQVGDNINQAKERLAFVQNASVTAQEKLECRRRQPGRRRRPRGGGKPAPDKRPDRRHHQGRRKPGRGPQRPGVRRRGHLPGPGPGPGPDPVRGAPRTRRTGRLGGSGPGAGQGRNPGRQDRSDRHPGAGRDGAPVAGRGRSPASATSRSRPAVRRPRCSRASCPRRRRSARPLTTSPPAAAAWAPRRGPAWRKPSGTSTTRCPSRAPTPSPPCSTPSRPHSLAAQAAQQAQSDVDHFGGYANQGYGRGGMFGGGGGGGLGGAILGGILINSILHGGGGGGGGWGGGGDSGGGWGGGGDSGGGWGGDFGGGGDF